MAGWNGLQGIAMFRCVAALCRNETVGNTGSSFFFLVLMLLGGFPAFPRRHPPLVDLGLLVSGGSAPTHQWRGTLPFCSSCMQARQVHAWPDRCNSSSTLPASDSWLLAAGCRLLLCRYTTCVLQSS